MAIFVLPLLLKFYRDKQLQDAYREVINEKEKQIQRLADDNREWRNYFWHTKGLTEREIMQIERQSDGNAIDFSTFKKTVQRSRRIGI